MRTLIFALICGFALFCHGQIDSIKPAKKDTIRGLRFAFLPSVSFDSDLGFKYGLLTTAYQFGDGSLYPDYVYSILYEINRTTKGSGISQLFFDSGKLLKGGKHRIVADFSIIGDQAMDFYGFNGAASQYIAAYENENDSNYISRMYYNFDRSIIRLTADWHRQLNENIGFSCGIHYYGYKQKSVDIAKLNKGKDAEDMLPDTITLYDYYCETGVIDSVQADGGNVTLLRAGIVYDTRDVQFNPSKGQWFEALLSVSPKFPWVETPFVRASVILRNYLPIVKNKLTFASRVAWQDNLGNQAPFYFAPYISQTYCNNNLVEGPGGAKTLRGILRNRIWGDGFMYGNLELRWSVVRFRTINQKFEIKLKPFYDFGIITDSYKFEITSALPGNYPPLLLSADEDQWHHSTGAGIHFVMNDNFILTIDYGRSLKANDGKSGLYIGTGFLF